MNIRPHIGDIHRKTALTNGRFDPVGGVRRLTSLNSGSYLRASGGAKDRLERAGDPCSSSLV